MSRNSGSGRLRIRLGLALLISAGSALSAAGAVTFTPILLSNDAPLIEDVGIRFIDTQSASPTGEALVGVTLAQSAPLGITPANASLLYRRSASGQWSIVARTGDIAPDAGGTYISLTGGLIGAGGNAAFRAYLTDKRGTGYFAPATGTNQLAVLQGEPAPDGTVFSTISTGRQRLNNAGTLLEGGPISLQAAIGGPGLWLKPAGQPLTTVARWGQSAPGMGNGTFTRAMGVFSRLQLNNSNEVAFAGEVEHPDNNIINRGVWRTSAGGQLSLVTDAGNSPALNDAGRVVYRGFETLPGYTGVGLFAQDRNGTKTALVKTLDPAPGTPFVFKDLASVDLMPLVINGAGDVAFATRLYTAASSSIASEGVFLRLANGTLKTLATRQLTAPGTAKVYGSMDSVEVAINSGGNVLFQLDSSISTGVTNGGLWHYDRDSDLVSLVVGEGQLFQVNPGDVRTIARINIDLNHGTEDGNAKGLIDDGRILLGLNFTDGSSGVFFAQVPEPAGLLSLATFGVLSLARRRRAAQARSRSVLFITKAVPL